MNDTDSNIPTYPMITFFLSHGRWLSLLLGVLLFAAGIYAAILSGLIIFAVAGLVAGALVTGLLVSYVELLRIVADTLMPR